MSLPKSIIKTESQKKFEKDFLDAVEYGDDMEEYIEQLYKYDLTQPFYGRLLKVALLNGFHDLAELLLEGGAPLVYRRRNIIFDFVQEKDHDAVNLLIAYGAKKNDPAVAKEHPKDSKFSLMCKENDYDPIEYLISLGKHKQDLKRNDSSCIYYSIFNNNYQMLELLIESGFNAGPNRDTAHTPLEYAIGLGSSKKIINLLENNKR